ncbi:MAG: VC0807 family protein [Oligoflexus sp.]
MTTAPKQENPFLSLLLNIVIPSMILMKLSNEENLGPVIGLLVALSFPLAYGIYDFIDRKKINFISILGLISILLTGVFTLVKLAPHWIAIKEASVPTIIGAAILLSLKTEFPLVKKLLVNDTILNLDLIHEKLALKSNELAFDRLLVKASYLLASSFFLSAALNYGLAKYLLVAEPGSTQFNEQLGQMTALSWPVIVLPSMAVMMFALFRLISGIKQLTDLELEQILKSQPKTDK